ncbi:MAG: response regulator [Myxococcales bacterium]|nr:response regulator [Myxococcales bacterium]
MKQILFVDDEPLILDGLRNRFRRRRREWDMSFAASGDEALQMLREAPVDVVVTDMRMPGMDGASLLQHVRDLHPNTVRVVLSGYTEREVVLRAISVAHQALSKPCPPQVLEAVIDRALKLRGVISDWDLSERIGRTSRLPPAPRVYGELTRKLEQPRTTARDIAHIVERDVAMSAKVLQLVNSSFFAPRVEIASVESAVTRLGFDLVKNLVLMLEVFDKSGMNSGERDLVEDLQEHALLTARIAWRIIDDRREPAEAFAAALLHDVGKLIIDPEDPTKTGHERTGACLLGIWGLPDRIVEAAAFHHMPKEGAQEGIGVLCAVHVADALAYELSGAEDHEHVKVDLEYLESVGASDRLDSWKAAADECYEKMKAES